MPEYGPQTPAGQALFKQKYCLQGETPRDVYNRVAATLKDSDSHYHAFREILGSGRFVPAGRNLSSIGSSKGVCSHNCFVSGRIEDSFVSGAGSIMDRAKEAATTMRMGGGIGYDFSTIRPRGSLIKKLDSNATGPVSFMHIFDAIGLATCSSGHRRGAQMGILRVDHPDIWEFVHAKQTPGALTGFNISVAVTNQFMRAVEEDGPFDLLFDGEVHKTIRAVDLWEAIMRSAWDWAEPGVVFIDAMNTENNLAYCEEIFATNPCSEQPLPPFGACLLGSFNLPRYLVPDPRRPGGFVFDYDQLKTDIPHVVRAMDNVNDVALYPLAEQKAEALAKRRMGLGVMGLANAIEAIGFAYGSSDFIGVLHSIFTELKNDCYKASALLAKEKGAFPLFDRDLYMKSQYVRRLDNSTQDMIREHGIRNSHLISVAPTGTIAQIMDNVSGGIEPVFEVLTDRIVQTLDGPQTLQVEDYGARVLGVVPKTSGQVSADEHINVLCAVQLHTDSAVSKTCNVDGSMEWDAFKSIYHKAWRRGAKGCSVYNKDGKRGAVLTASKPVGEAGCASGACEI